ncbi:MAG: IS3 family transposase [Cyclobacteriaceae bacterium]|nr:IS3 family transposase [Cyclobacteriaceae bacterium]
MKYDFIDKNKTKHCIRKMAKILDISRSGYYAWRSHSRSKRSITNDGLLKSIKDVFYKSKKRYGSPRIHADLNDQGISCNPKTVARIMKEYGLVAVARKKYRPTTNSKHNFPIAENLLNRNFKVSKPNKAWVSDITYIFTKEGWQYLCIIIDLFNREVIGWSLNHRMKQDLVIMAINMGIQKKKPKEGLIFHSDRGSQYAAKKVSSLLKCNGILQSMSRKGNCWDNACAESFFHSLKVEEVYTKKYKTRSECRISIFEYIEIFYNRIRRHSHLGYKSPVQFESDYKKTA